MTKIRGETWLFGIKRKALIMTSEIKTAQSSSAEKQLENLSKQQELPEKGLLGVTPLNEFPNDSPPNGGNRLEHLLKEVKTIAK